MKANFLVDKSLFFIKNKTLVALKVVHKLAFIRGLFCGQFCFFE